MAERDHIDHEIGTENGEAMHTDAIRAETIHTGTTDVITTDDPAPSARRRGPDPLTLLVGLATLAMAVFAFVGDLPDLSGFDPRWLLAGGAAVVGLVLLVGNLAPFGGTARRELTGRRGRSGEPAPKRANAALGRSDLPNAAFAPSAPAGYSHSMVPGGLLVTSSTTRLTSATSFVIRVEMRSSTSYGSRVQSAVIASSELTGRSTTGCP